jgi:hypothetical protein
MDDKIKVTFLHFHTSFLLCYLTTVTAVTDLPRCGLVWKLETSAPFMAVK